jgi:hypothetical protein
MVGIMTLPVQLSQATITSKSDVGFDLLSSSFQNDLTADVKLYGESKRTESRMQFSIGRKVKAYIEINHDALEQEGRTLDELYEQIAEFMNQQAGWQVTTSTGRTIRSWRETLMRFSDKAIAEFEQKVRFSHLESAVWLYNQEDVNSPVEALQAAVDHNWTADDMKSQLHYMEPTSKSDLPLYKRFFIRIFGNPAIDKIMQDEATPPRVVELLKELKEIQ